MAPHAPPLTWTSILQSHLAQWGLRKFLHEQAYSAWQRERLSQQDLQTLHAISLRRQGGQDPSAEIEFYDKVATPYILPVLYSQRYSFYETVGLEILARLSKAYLSGARKVLDFGCGVGILTTLFARLFPGMTFVGLDRSAESIGAGRQFTKSLELPNLAFVHAAIPSYPSPEPFDVIVATHALFQAESDPGLPSQSWETFSRGTDDHILIEAERRTGLQDRLDFLRASLTADGSCILVEKARHLGRRILLQRALARRGFHLVEEPQLLSYDTLGEDTADGPLYHLSFNEAPVACTWNEEPERDIRHRFYICRGRSAQSVLSRFPDRRITGRETYCTGSAGETTIEWGKAGKVLSYGLVIVRPGEEKLLIGGGQDESAIIQELHRLTQREKPEGTGKAFADALRPTSADHDHSAVVPLYENHSPSAQDVWAMLPSRIVTHSQSAQEPDGRQRHIELGFSEQCAYLYWSNTFDQRQLVLMERANGHLLKQYYDESIEAAGHSNP